MENRYTESLIVDYNNEDNFVPIALAAANPGTAAAIASGLAALQKIKAVKAVADKIGDLAGKIGIGGVKDDRFIAMRNGIEKEFIAAGYLPASKNPSAPTMKSFKIDLDSVPNKKTKGNYAAEYENLRRWCVAMLNYYNPGLGNLWQQYFPKFIMHNLGEIKTQGALEALNIIIDSFAPGTFDPAITTLPSATAEIVNAPDAPQQTVTPISNPGAVSTTQLTPGGTVTQNDTPGNVMATGLPMNLSKTNLMIMAGILVGVVILFFVFKK